MWKGILRQVRQGIREDNVPLAAAGLSFYAVLATFPALVAVVSLYGLVANPQAVERQVHSFSSRALPFEARRLLQTQLEAIVRKPAGSLNLGLFLSLALLLFSASAGTYALIRSLNIAYEVKETRRLLKLRATAFVLAIAAIVFVLLGLATIAVVPPLFARLGVEDGHNILVVLDLEDVRGRQQAFPVQLASVRITDDLHVSHSPDGHLGVIVTGS